MTRVTIARIVRISCLLLVTTFVLSSSQAAESDGLLTRAVLVDPQAKAAYLAAPGGGIDAVDLSSGRTLWSSRQAALPLAVIGRNLVAQVEEAEPASRLRIAIFDLTAGGRKLTESTIPLPEDVHALVADELERTFRATAQEDGNGVVVSWTFTHRSMEGMKGTDREPDPPRVVRGSARIDFSTGRVVDVPHRRATATDGVAEQLMQASKLTALPKRAGNVLAATEGGRGGPLRLKRWDATTGQALPDRLLLSKAIVALASADGSHVVASERVGAGGPDDPEYRWSVFSAETGDLKGQLRRDTSASPFVLSDDNLVFEAPAHGYKRGALWIDEPLKLRAVRISTSVPVWDHEVRELRYRGRVPPSARAASPPAPKPAKAKSRGHQ